MDVSVGSLCCLHEVKGMPQSTSPKKPRLGTIETETSVAENHGTNPANQQNISPLTTAERESELKPARRACHLAAIFLSLLYDIHLSLHLHCNSSIARPSDTSYHTHINLSGDLLILHNGQGQLLRGYACFSTSGLFGQELRDGGARGVDWAQEHRKALDNHHGLTMHRSSICALRDLPARSWTLQLMPTSSRDATC